MRLFGYLIAACLGGQIQFLNVPKGTKIRKDLQLTSQNVLDVHSILTGNEPSHILPHEVFESFDVFNPAEKSVILLSPKMIDGPTQSVEGPFISESIELKYPSDGADAVKTAAQNQIVLKIQDDSQDIEAFVNEIKESLAEKFGDNFLLSILIDSDVTAEKVADRQILQSDQKSIGGTVEPRNSIFPVIFVIVFGLVLFSLFGLVWISYEMVNMEPGDNIAYKLNAAYSKKNL